MYVYEYICIYIIPSMLGWFSQKSGRSISYPFIKPPGSRLHTGHRGYGSPSGLETGSMDTITT